MLQLPKSRRPARFFLSAGLIVASAIYAFRQDLTRPGSSVPSRKIPVAARPVNPRLSLSPSSSAEPTISNSLTSNVPKESTPQPLMGSAPHRPPDVTETVPRPPEAANPRAALADTHSLAVIPPAPPPHFQDGYFEGGVVETPYGPVQVTIAILQDRITSVQCPQFPNDRLRSQEISNSAIPTLIEEVIQAQSADINIVSGATETSVGFYESLKSSLEKAKNVNSPPN
jgi:uncharacterized protein with FMN-binding domain